MIYPTLSRSTFNLKYHPRPNSVVEQFSGIALWKGNEALRGSKLRNGRFGRRKWRTIWACARRALPGGVPAQETEGMH